MNHSKSLLIQGQCLLAAMGAFVLSLPTPTQAQSINACRPLSKQDTVVIIDASSSQRIESINQVVQKNSLQGEFCVTRKGRTVWMSEGLDSGDSAIQVFNYFENAGLIKPVKVRRTA